MEYGRIANVDKPVSRLVQGTIMLSTAEEEYSFDLLDQVYEAGINTFDSGHLYGGGDCERVLGRWIEERDLRDEVVILTKCCHMNADRERVTPYDISSDLHDSLARLRTNYIDLYLLHRDDIRVPVGPIVDRLNHYIGAGNLGVIGGSNWTHDRIERANLYAATSGQQPFTVSSPNFSLAEQAEPPWRGCISISGQDGAAARTWYQENQMPLFTWSSIANGFFSGRVNRDNYDSLVEQGLFDESAVRGLLHRRQLRTAGPRRSVGGGEGTVHPPDRPGLRARTAFEYLRPGGRAKWRRDQGESAGAADGAFGRGDDLAEPGTNGPSVMDRP